MRVNADTGDIEMSLEAMLGKRGNTRCMRQTIAAFYEWTAVSGDLRMLCMGCYDPFCDRDFLQGKCGEGVGSGV